MKKPNPPLNIKTKIILTATIIFLLSFISFVLSDAETFLGAPSNDANDITTGFGKSLQELANDKTLAKSHSAACKDNEGISGYNNQRNKIGCVRIQP